LCRRLKHDPKTMNIPVIFLTAKAEVEDEKMGLELGAVDYITKPISPPLVMARVKNHLALKIMADFLREKNVELSKAKTLSERLLLNVLPHSIAERLKECHDVIADYFPEVTVLFADIVGFTRFAISARPADLVILLNEIFTDFDNIADNRGLEKIKTIGDAYMAASGLPVSATDHAARAAHMALDMIDALARFNMRSNHHFQMRIGINSGAVVAGVIGKRKFTYDLWGDTVNTASRMESQGVAGRIQVTEATRRRLIGSFLFDERGIIDVEDVGEMPTWFLIGRRGMTC